MREYQRDLPVSNFWIEVSSSQKSAQLNEFFIPVGIKGMLEGNGYRAVDMGFPFIASFIARATGYTENALLTTVHTAYSSLVNNSLNKIFKEMCCAS